MKNTSPNSYVKTNVRENIFDIIKRSSIMGQSLMWQNIDDEKKAYEIEKIELNQKIHTLFLYLKEKTKFDIASPIYIKLSHRETIFKAKFLAHFEEVVSIEIPKEMMTKENRADPRHRFKMIDKANVTLSYEINLIKSSWQNIDFTLLDLGPGGFSLICNEKMAKLLSTVKRFYVDAFKTRKLEEPIEASFVYSQTGKYKIHGKIVTQNRVGFKFHKRLNLSELESLLTFLKGR